jgi:hypothetical protein
MLMPKVGDNMIYDKNVVLKVGEKAIALEELHRLIVKFVAEGVANHELRYGDQSRFWPQYQRAKADLDDALREVLGQPAP